MKTWIKLLGTKTAIGGFLTVGAWLFSQETLDPTTIIQAGGALFAILGGRHAIEKSGPTK